MNNQIKILNELNVKTLNSILTVDRWHGIRETGHLQLF